MASSNTVSCWSVVNIVAPFLLVVFLVCWLLLLGFLVHVGGGCSLDGCFGVGAFFDVVADSVAGVGYSGGFGGRSGGCPPGYASVPDCSTGVGLDSFRVAYVVRI